MVAGRVYWTILEECVRRALPPILAGGGPPDEDARFSPEDAERLGQWSLRWLEAQDNAARNLAGRYEALSDHLRRMNSLEDGSFVREMVERSGLPKGRPVESKPSQMFAEVARFFRPVDMRGIDRIVPESVEFERPLDSVQIGVTAAERVVIANRTYRAILDVAIDRFLSPRRAGEGRRDEAAIFDSAFAERLANWSDLCRHAQDEAAKDASSQSAVARHGSSRSSLVGTTLAGPDALPATVEAHIERMTALETGHFLDDALERSGRPPGQSLDMTRIREFVAVARFLRMEAETQLPEALKQRSADVTTASRAGAAGRIYQAILDAAARRYLAIPRAGNARADAATVFDTRLAERLASWSIRWGGAEAGAPDGPGPRFAAVRSHLERMTSLEEGRALHDALTRAAPHASAKDAPTPPREFADVLRFFRLEARWELELIKSR
jgi:hypothetical protein